MGMPAEREKRLLRTVTGGGQAVGAEPYPGKKGNQGYVLTRLVTEWIQRGTEQGCADRLHILRPSHTLRRRGRGKHTRSPPRVSDLFQMHVGCGAETFSLQMQEPMSLQSMVRTNGRCGRARAILERLSNGRLPKSIADLLRGELGAAKISGITIGTSRRNTTASDLFSRRNAAFERRVVPEDQHENSGEEGEERDGQQPGGEPASGILQVAHHVGCHEAGEI